MNLAFDCAAANCEAVFGIPYEKSPWANVTARGEDSPSARDSELAMILLYDRAGRSTVSGNSWD